MTLFDVKSAGNGLDVTTNDILTGLPLSSNTDGVLNTPYVVGAPQNEYSAPGCGGSVGVKRANPRPLSVVYGATCR